MYLCICFHATIWLLPSCYNNVKHGFLCNAVMLFDDPVSLNVVIMFIFVNVRYYIATVYITVTCWQFYSVWWHVGVNMSTWWMSCIHIITMYVWFHDSSPGSHGNFVSQLSVWLLHSHVTCSIFALLLCLHFLHMHVSSLTQYVPCFRHCPCLHCVSLLLLSCYIECFYGAVCSQLWEIS